MKKGFKTLFILFALCFVMILPSCGMLENYGIDDEIEAKVTDVMKTILKKDAKAMVKFYNQEMMDKFKTNSKAELETKKMLDFIDGDVLSYEYKGKGEYDRELKGNEVRYFECHPEFEFKTSTDQTYTITFIYLHINKEDPNNEGLEGYTIRETGKKNNGYKSLTKFSG